MRLQLHISFIQEGELELMQHDLPREENFMSAKVALTQG